MFISSPSRYRHEKKGRQRNYFVIVEENNTVVGTLFSSENSLFIQLWKKWISSVSIIILLILHILKFGVWISPPKLHSATFQKGKDVRYNKACQLIQRIPWESVQTTVSITYSSLTFQPASEQRASAFSFRGNNHPFHFLSHHRNC